MVLDTQTALEYYWALDSMSAEVFASRMDAAGQSRRLEAIYSPLGEIAIDDTVGMSRDRIGAIFRGESKEKLIAFGPCSDGNEQDLPVQLDELFDFIEKLQETYPGALFAVRLNGAKPRTGPDWTGSYYSLNPNSRMHLIEHYISAANRGIPALSEITQESQLGLLAPYLSAAWLGARDMQSTTLRTALSAYHLPAGVKNSISGQPKTVEDAVRTIRSNSKDRGNTGVELTIAGHMADVPLPVGQGNKDVAIFARGHELRKGTLAEEGRALALEHLGIMCTLGVELGATVIIDGSHDVPKMFNLATSEGKKDPDRLVPVLREIHRGIEEERVENASQIGGLIGEVGPDVGDTDPNFILDEAHKEQLMKVVDEFLNLEI